MADYYTSVTVSGYNASPPSDDGSTDASNKVRWSFIKTKLTDPLNTAIASINANVNTAVDSLNANIIEGGTIMLFMQTAAPTGWTKDTTTEGLNNTALRLTTGAVGSRITQSGFTTVFAINITSTQGHSLTTGQLAEHTHNGGSGGTQFAVNNSRYIATLGDPGVGTAIWFNTTTVNGSGSQAVLTEWDGSVTSVQLSDLKITGTSGSAGSGTAHSHDINGLDMRVNYWDVIKATRDE